MRKVIITAVALTILACGNGRRSYMPRSGDVIFHVSRSSQSLAIQRATKSRYSHMGVIFVKDGQPFVYEAVQPVKLTGFTEWTNRGEKKHYVVKRLKDADRRLDASHASQARS